MTTQRIADTWGALMGAIDFYGRTVRSIRPDETDHWTVTVTYNDPIGPPDTARFTWYNSAWHRLTDEGLIDLTA